MATLMSAWEALLPKSRRWPVVDEAARWRYPTHAGHSESGRGWSGKVTSSDSQDWSGPEHLLSAWRLALQGHETPWLRKVNDYCVLATHRQHAELVVCICLFNPHHRQQMQGLSASLLSFYR